MNMPVLILLSFIDHITLTLYGDITFNHSSIILYNYFQYVQTILNQQRIQLFNTHKKKLYYTQT